MQLNLFDQQKLKTIHRTKSRKRNERSKGKWTTEEYQVINMRKKLMTNNQIIRNCKFTAEQIRGLLQAYFKDQDPLNLEIIRLIKAGHSGKSIARDFKIKYRQVAGIAKKFKISLWDEYKKKIKKPKRKTINKAELANDLYCLLKTGDRLEDIARENGYRAASFYNRILLENCVDYAEKSKLKKLKQISNKRERESGRISKIFRFEKEMAQYLSIALSKDNIVEFNNRKICKAEIDLLIKKNGFMYLFELKIVSRKIDLATAFGQSIINRETYKSNCTGDVKVGICFARDLKIPIYFKRICKEFNIILCDEDSILIELNTPGPWMG